MLKRLLYCVILVMALSESALSRQTLSFGVVSQRSSVLTAQYWNPILQYVSEKSGVPLQLKLGKNGQETSAMVGRGEFDFVYTNHNFSARNDRVGYRVIARPIEAAIMGQIVVLADAPFHSLADLQGHEMAFPSRAAFVGYHVVMNALLQAGIEVTPSFVSNQEGAISQLKVGRVAAAGVNSQVMRDFAERENLRYRVLWSSEKYLSIPISAHPSVANKQVAAVQAALVGMRSDPEGGKVLAASAELIKQDPPLGFVNATDSEFENVRRFYQTSRVSGE
ncbi:MAG: phosphate/phosphite/phosphonate ABC transporter substrate-binding protein [Burkholderiales bacterium]|nr:phosphate/phosphite/phosphonate ABC transporter substrate-binding protein [Burkholderiales bacterium]